MSLEIIVSTNNSTNTNLSVYDATDYPTLGISINDINAVRFLFATYQSQAEVAQVASLLANYEYTVISGSFIMDDETTYNTGVTFVARKDYELPTTGVVVFNTGFYSTYNPLLPKDVENFDFVPSDLGENSTTFSDKARTIRYEGYTQEYQEGDPLDDGIYIVKGTLGDFITLSTDQVYYVGEVFTGIANDDFVGTPVVVRQFDTTDNVDTWTDANSSVIYQSYVNSLSNSTLNASEDFKDNFIRTNTCFSNAYIQSATAIRYYFSSIQTNLDIIVNYLGVKNKNVR